METNQKLSPCRIASARQHLAGAALLLCLATPSLPCHARPANVPETPARSRTQLSGSIVQRGTRTPIANAVVSVAGTNIVVSAGSDGRYRLPWLPQGQCIVEVKAPGYRTQTRTLAPTAAASTLDFELTPDEISLDEVVVSSNRTVTLRREAPSLVNIIDAKLLQATNSCTLAQGLNFQPGVRTETNCQNCGFSQVRLNGLDGHYSQILIDSRPIFSSLNGVYGLEQIPSNMIERIEVVRGGGSALYGASAIGGTINVITKEPLRNSGEFSHLLTAIGGTGSWENNTTANASLVTDDGRAGLYLYGQHHYRPGYDHDHDGYTELPNLNNTTVGFSSFLRLNPHSKFTLQYHNLSEFRRGGNLLDRAPHEANITEQIEHSINGGNLAYDFISAEARHQAKAYFSFHHTARKSYYGGTGENASDEDRANALKAYGRTRDLTYVAGTQYTRRFDRLLLMPANLTLGAEYNHTGLDDRIPGYGRHLEQRVNIWSAFAQNEWKNRQWSLLAGCRIDRHNLVHRAILSPRVNLRFNPAEPVSLRASYAAGFRAPQAFDEELHVGLAGGERIMTVAAPGLRHERSHSFSLSADWVGQWGGLQVNLLGEAFYTRLTDVFGLRQLSEQLPDGTHVQERYNASAAHVAGANLEGKLAYGRWVSLQAGLTLQQSRYHTPQTWDEEAPAERRMMRTPDTYAYFALSSAPASRLSVSLSGNYTGHMLVPHLAGSGISRPEAVRVRDFLVLNLKLAYALPTRTSLGLELNAGVQNLANAYQNDFDRGWNRDSGYIYGPGSPRCFFAGIRAFY
ncbi:outer membrane receptor for ferrienterochelin and colicins [Prevotella dentalis DSM 3688]|uniref:Outer membrane receptor for ferrienterochelin and colicins n=1 Tax=Prevotella dentalis (strain ATCC 49559 / DSM 3688 / JCM 13448 / NCTC 12043 / ES 2772) TaxID=908937 RepID=F9D4J4_PREDD|nr:TonB-dependent receptor [Prevotella dentalis]AGB28901.1 outer membrane receptor for ferrienterochelin and colicins [Prevotella dentalis DSM 3688]EGQ13746.1 TonB-dependent outer membrane receptor [Prevotella dentalis DSM 3688]